MKSLPPVHVGIIMDGNGRWAKKRNLQRIKGHQEGLSTAKNIVKAVCSTGIQYLTLYTFSTENWKRTGEEVFFLIGLIKNSLRSEYDFYKTNDICVVHSGDLSVLPTDIQNEILLAEQETRDFSSLTVNLAINYGGRDEILRALKSALLSGIPLQDIREEHIQRFLDQASIPDLDLIIRTGGEQRLSNFMLWRISYAEIYFTKTLWPDFAPSELNFIIDWYQERTRRFGGSGTI